MNTEQFKGISLHVILERVNSHVNQRFISQTERNDFGSAPDKAPVQQTGLPDTWFRALSLFFGYG